jgi:hypothetical protein
MVATAEATSGPSVMMAVTTPQIRIRLWSVLTTIPFVTAGFSAPPQSQLEREADSLGGLRFERRCSSLILVMACPFQLAKMRLTSIQLSLHLDRQTRAAVAAGRSRWRPRFASSSL